MPTVTDFNSQSSLLSSYLKVVRLNANQTKCNTMLVVKWPLMIFFKKFSVHAGSESCEMPQYHKPKSHKKRNLYEKTIP